MKRSFVFITALLMIAFSTFIGSYQVASAAFRPLATRDYGFNCIIPKFTDSRCGPGPFTMTAGKYAQVNLVSSGANYCTTFTLRNNANGNAFGSTYVCPGNTKTIWTNTTGQTVSVYFTANPDGVVDVQIQGFYKFGEF